MRRLLLAVVSLALVAGAGLAQQEEKEKAPKFRPPEVVSTVESLYPPNSAAWGTVIFEVALDEAGKIEDVRVVRDIPSLTEPAREALKKWSFRPATLDQKPVRSKMAVAFTFNTPLLMQRPPR